MLTNHLPALSVGANLTLTKRDIILHGSCFCEKWIIIITRAILC